MMDHQSSRSASGSMTLELELWRISVRRLTPLRFFSSCESKKSLQWQLRISQQSRSLSCWRVRLWYSNSKSTTDTLSRVGYYSSRCRLDRYGCRIASCTVIRFQGSNVSSFRSRSRADGEVSPNSFSNDLPGLFGIDLIILRLYSGNDFMFQTLGVPKNQQISQISFLVSVPGSNGLLLIISANMQPTDHMSTDVVYSRALSRSSGALYQRVVTQSVMTLALVPGSEGSKARASPKSHILRSQLELTRMFLGLRSRWTTLAEWMYFKPRRSWYRKNWQCQSVSGWLDLMMEVRSVSISYETTQMSLNSCLLLGSRMVSMLIMFSCFMSFRSLSSRSVRLVNILCQKALSIFLMATILPSFSLLRADTTTPQAPWPSTSMMSYLSSIQNLCLLMKLVLNLDLVLTQGQYLLMMSSPSLTFYMLPWINNYGMAIIGIRLG